MMRITRYGILALAVGWMGLLSSCVTIGRVPSAEAMAKVLPGKTTEAEALAILGPPEETERGHGRTLHQWSSTPVKAGLGSSKVGMNTVDVLVSSSGVVEKAFSHQSSMSSSGVILPGARQDGQTKPPDPSRLRRGMTLRAAESVMGPPLVKRLTLQGGKAVVWTMPVSGFDLAAERMNLIATVFSDKDRLIRAVEHKGDQRRELPLR